MCVLAQVGAVLALVRGATRRIPLPETACCVKELNTIASVPVLGSEMAHE